MGDSANLKALLLFSPASSLFPPSSLPSLFPSLSLPLSAPAPVEEKCIDESDFTSSAHLHSFQRVSPKKKKCVVYQQGHNHLHDYVVEVFWLNVFRLSSVLASALCKTDLQILLKSLWGLCLL